nr:lytic transglycosylase domain-containing protein [Motilimonas eburnea]
MIESAFRTVALSNKGAHGVWQLMPATAKELGIRPEQRKDVVKATDAAIKYIQARQQAFGNDALLIAASYNAGEYGVSRRFEKVDSGRYNFVTIYDHLPKETRHYVPRWIAATMLANQIKRQGKMPPSEAVIITRRDYQIAPLAKGLGMDVAQFERLNPDFVGARFLTHQHNFIVHPNSLPVNAVDGIHISAATGFTPQFIAAQNDLVPTRAQVEDQQRKDRLAQQAKKPKPKVKLSPKTQATVASSVKSRPEGYIKVEIKPGMTYTRLSRWFGVSQQELMKLNPSLKQGLQAGKQIKVPANGVLVKQYKVQQGDSLMQIARQHRLDLDDIRLINQIKDNHIRVGQVLTLYLPQG